MQKIITMIDFISVWQVSNSKEDSCPYTYILSTLSSKLILVLLLLLLLLLCTTSIQLLYIVQESVSNLEIT